jgi:hypothetical protein
LDVPFIVKLLEDTLDLNIGSEELYISTLELELTGPLNTGLDELFILIERDVTVSSNIGFAKSYVQKLLTVTISSNIGSEVLL